MQVWEEILILVLSVEGLSRLPAEARHLKLIDHEPLALNKINNLAHLSVAVRLDHGERSLSLLFEVSTSGHIAIIDDFQDTREDRDLCPNEKVVELD